MFPFSFNCWCLCIAVTIQWKAFLYSLESSLPPRKIIHFGAFCIFWNHLEFIFRQIGKKSFFSCRRDALLQDCWLLLNCRLIFIHSNVDYMFAWEHSYPVTQSAESPSVIKMLLFSFTCWFFLHWCQHTVKGLSYSQESILPPTKIIHWSSLNTTFYLEFFFTYGSWGIKVYFFCWKSHQDVTSLLQEHILLLNCRLLFIHSNVDYMFA